MKEHPACCAQLKKHTEARQRRVLHRLICAKRVLDLFTARVV